MSRQTRRTFLKASGTLLGAMGAGVSVTAATSRDRFTVDAKKVSESDLSGTDLSVVHDLDAIDYLVVEGPESDVKGLGVDYAPDVVYQLEGPAVEPTTYEESSVTTDDTLYPFQWDKEVQNIPDAHEVTRGEGTRVGIIDTGVDADHPALSGAVNSELSRDFTGDGYGVGQPYGGFHGTHVAGIIASNGGTPMDADGTGSDSGGSGTDPQPHPAEGAIGTAPETEIVDCRLFGHNKYARITDLIPAMIYTADVNCDILNMSLGLWPLVRQDTFSFYFPLINDAASYCERNGTMVVIAAGNDDADHQHDKNYYGLLAEIPNSTTVAATGPIGYRWGDEGLEEPPYSPSIYTNYGTNIIDIAAPGGDYIEGKTNPNWYLDVILSSYSQPIYDEDDNYLGANRGWAWTAGTSMATPQAVGAAALVKSVNPDYNPSQIQSTLERTASVPEGYDKAYYGSGFIDPNAAVRD